MESKMNTKKIVGAAVLTAFAASIAPASAAVFEITPATHADGYVTAVDTAAKTVTVGGQTYAVRSALELIDVPQGAEADVTYFVEGGKRVILSITPREEGDDLVE
jgi:hypothetical protein